MRSEPRSGFAEISGPAISGPFPPGWEHFTLTYGFHPLKITDAGGRLGSHSFYLGRRVLRESSRPPEVPHRLILAFPSICTSNEGTRNRQGSVFFCAVLRCWQDLTYLSDGHAQATVGTRGWMRNAS